MWTHPANKTVVFFLIYTFPVNPNINWITFEAELHEYDLLEEAFSSLLVMTLVKMTGVARKVESTVQYSTVHNITVQYLGPDDRDGEEGGEYITVQYSTVHYITL